MTTPDRPTELREEIFRCYHDAGIRVHVDKVPIDELEQLFEARSRTDQMKLLESILKVRNGIEENYPHLCYWYERKMNEALARLEGEGK